MGNTIFFPQNYTSLWQVCVLQAHTYSDRALWMQDNSCCQYRPQPNQFLLEYYAFRGPAAETVANAASSTPEMVKDTIGMFADIGMDELMFWPCIPNLDQVDWLADLIE